MDSTQGRRLSGLRIADRSAWIAEVSSALGRAGNVPEAAKLLGTAERTLYRWLREEPALRRAASLPEPGRRSTVPDYSSE